MLRPWRWRSVLSRDICSKPVAPYCASDGDLSDQYTSRAKCSDEVERYIKELGRYLDCLTTEVRETEAEISRFRELVADKGTHR